jgi:integrase
MTFKPAPIPRKPGRKHLSLSEWRRLLAAAEKQDSFRDYVIVRLMYVAGLRAGEVGLMRLDHCKRLHKGQLYVQRRKGSTSRWVDIDPETIEHIARWINELYPNRTKRRPSAFLFPGVRYKGTKPAGLSRVTVFRLIKRLCEAAGVPEEVSHPHAIRHARSQHLFEAADAQGIPLDTVLQSVAQILGHTAAQTTLKHYVAETGQGKQLARAVLARALDKE